MKGLIMACLAISLIIVVVSSELSTERILYDSLLDVKKTKEAFKMWHYLEKKSYSLNTEEGLNRYRIFKENVKYIKERNLVLNDYQLGLGPFTDLTFEEYKKAMLNEMRYSEGKKQMRELAEINFDEMADAEVESNKLGADYDWTAHYNGNVKNQGRCGSCWAFSVSGSVEGLHSQKNQKYTGLSAQTLVDCEKKSKGCNGGGFGSPFAYVRTDGLATDADYPYKAAQCICRTDKPRVKITGYKFCSNYYKSASNNCQTSTTKCSDLIQTSPLSVGIDAGSRDFQSYSKGIFTATCNNDNHAVIMVQMTATFNRIRNSWGASWGNGGYISVGKNLTNKFSCFTENECYSPYF